MKKILSQSPFFLIFFGILGYLIYSSNFDKKMTKIDEKINAECREFSKEKTPEWKYEQETYKEYRKRYWKIFDPCKKRKWEELGLYEKYQIWTYEKF